MIGMGREKICGIYKIENLINGKVYIGQSNDIYRRWVYHKNSVFNKNNKCYNRPLYKDIREYGIENFSFEILEKCDEKDLDDLEKMYIKKYRSFVGFYKSNGYNLTLGGGGMLGKESSEETKMKISKANKDKLKGGKNPSAKKVMCENMEFSCAKECAKYYNIQYTTLKSWLNGNHNIPQEWYDKNLHYFDKSMEDYEVQKGFSGKNHTRSIIVYCEGRKFANVRECAEYYNINMHTMKNWINGANDMPQEWYDKGLHKEGKNMRDYKIQEKKVIVCDGILFNSIRECAEYYGVNKVTMQSWLSGRNKMPQEFIDKGLSYY